MKTILKPVQFTDSLRDELGKISPNYRVNFVAKSKKPPINNNDRTYIYYDAGDEIGLLGIEIEFPHNVRGDKATPENIASLCHKTFLGKIDEIVEKPKIMSDEDYELYTDV